MVLAPSNEQEYQLTTINDLPIFWRRWCTFEREMPEDLTRFEFEAVLGE